MLKPIPETSFWPLRWFNFAVQRSARGYRSVVRKLARKFIIVLLFVGFLLLDFAFLKTMKTSFIPLEDQGIVMVDVQLPEGATFARTQAVMDQVISGIRSTPGVKHATSVIGFSLLGGSGENTAITFVSLDPWEKR